MAAELDQIAVDEIEQPTLPALLPRHPHLAAAPYAQIPYLVRPDAEGFFGLPATSKECVFAGVPTNLSQAPAMHRTTQPAAGLPQSLQAVEDVEEAGDVRLVVREDLAASDEARPRECGDKSRDRRPKG